VSEHILPETYNTDPDSAPAAQHRVRIYFRKGNEIKYVSHLDLLRAWERAIRRSGLPLAYSQGFSPHPKITIAMPLAVGCTGENEALDVILEAPTTEREIIRALGPVMPPGLSVVSAEPVALKSPALTTLFSQAVYEVLLVGPAEIEISRRIDDLLQQESVLVEFRGKQFDLRPLVGSLELSETATADTAHPAVTLRAVLLRDDKGRIGRPDVLLEALGLIEYALQIHRSRVLYQTKDSP
jgi:radical SAM-linked protein